MDPIAVLTTIGTGLGLVDQFYDLSKKVLGEKTGKHRVNVEPQNDKLVVIDGDYEQEIRAHELNLGKFDKVRNDTLRKRIEINWAMYNGIDVKRAAAAADEKVRLKIQMDELKGELCPDFKELVRMYEKVLGVSLPDHYTLYDVCA